MGTMKSLFISEATDIYSILLNIIHSGKSDILSNTLLTYLHWVQMSLQEEISLTQNIFVWGFYDCQ